MTENEAIEKIRMMPTPIFDNEADEALKMAIQALEEIQLYHELGTTTQIIGQQYELHTFHAVGTVEEFKALKENERKCEDCAGCTNWKCDCANIRAKAISEFAERMKVKCDAMSDTEWNKTAHPLSWADAYETFKDDIDDIAEELKGGAE